MGKLDGKVALVTGASGGIGRAIAKALAQEGAAIGINYNTNKQEALNLGAYLAAHGGRQFCLLQGDVSQSGVADALVKQTIENLGRLDILINCAGIIRDNLLMRMTDEEWDAVLATNLRGAFLTTRAAMRTLLKQRAGRIINITSVSGILGTAGQANYAAAKAGMIALTQTTARELATRDQIAVNAVAPGFTKTKMTDDLPQKVKDEILAQIPQHRFAEPDEIAEMVVFLCTCTPYITGQVFAVDGGLTI